MPLSVEKSVGRLVPVQFSACNGPASTMPTASGSCGRTAPGSAACAGAGLVSSSHKYTLPISNRLVGSLSRSTLARTAPISPGSSIVRITDCSTLIGLLSLTGCLLYTSDAADDLLCVDLGG